MRLRFWKRTSSAPDGPFVGLGEAIARASQGFPGGAWVTAYFAPKPTRWRNFRARFTWAYIRQTRLLLPLTERWLNR